MKNAITKTFAILLLFATAVTNFSCSKDEDNQPDLLLGKWYWVSSVTPKVVAANQKSAATTATAASTYTYILFKADAAYEEGVETSGVGVSGFKSTYTRTANGYTYKWDKDIVVMKVTELTTDKLVVVDGDGETSTFTKTSSKATPIGLEM